MIDQGPAPAGGSEGAQAGGKAGGAELEEGAADGAAEKEAEAAGMEAPVVALGQMPQVCEQGMPATEVALPGLGGEGMLAGKRKREELTGQPGRHSLWEQGPLGAGFHARQGWTGEGGIGSWWSEVAGLEGAGDVPQCPPPSRGKGSNGEVQAGGQVGGAAPEEGVEDGAEVEEAVTARQEASEEALEQVLQVCEQDTSATDDALSDIRGKGMLAGKRKKGEELAHQHVRHSLWE